MNESSAREYLLCPTCMRGPFTVVPFARGPAGLRDGVLVCEACGDWCRVEDGLAELLEPGLRDQDRARSFAARHASDWNGWTARAPGEADADGTGAALKTAQRAFFRRHAGRYDDRILDSPFWVAFDELLLGALAAEPSARGVAVDVGSGTGRHTRWLAERFSVVLSFDLSEDMLREAVTKTPSRPEAGGTVLRFVADAERIPVRSGIADRAVMLGVLSYLASPDRAVAEVARLLGPGGSVIGQENNRSIFRPGFDLLMSLRRSWVAKSYPARGVLDRRDLAGWLQGAGLSASIRTGVFLPPQIFNLLRAAAAKRLLRTTDAAGGRVPWIRRQGGLLLFRATRPTAPALRIPLPA